MADPFVGEIRMLPFTFAPIDWLPCDGRILNITQYDVLFAVIGTQYGGNGTTQFNLPDLRGAAAMGRGTGPGLTPRTLGQKVGAETVALNSNTVPAHTHPMSVSNTNATQSAPANNGTNSIGTFIDGTTVGKIYGPTTTTTNFAGAFVGPSGNGAPTPHANQQPFLTLQFCICYNGIFPQQA